MSSTKYIRYERSDLSLRFLCFLEICETISLKNCFTNSIKYDEIDYLIKKCPSVKNSSSSLSSSCSENNQNENENSTGQGGKSVQFESNDEITEMTEIPNNSNLRYRFLKDENQEALLSLGYFLIESKGKFCKKIILSKILSILIKLPECKWFKYGQKITPEFFSYNLLKILKDVSEIIPNLEKEIGKAVILCIENSMNKMKQFQQRNYFSKSRNFNGMIFGIFKALSEGVFESLDEKQIIILFKFIKDFVEISSNIPKIIKRQTAKKKLLISMNRFSLKILKHIVKQLKYEKEMFLKIFKSYSLSHIYFKQILDHEKDNNIFIDFTNLAIELGVVISIKCYQNNDFETFEKIYNRIQYVLTKFDELKKTNEAIHFFVDVIKYLENLCCQTLNFEKFIDVFFSILDYELNKNIEKQLFTSLNVVLVNSFKKKKNLILLNRTTNRLILMKEISILTKIFQVNYQEMKINEISRSILDFQSEEISLRFSNNNLDKVITRYFAQIIPLQENEKDIKEKINFFFGLYNMKHVKQKKNLDEIFQTYLFVLSSSILKTQQNIKEFLLLKTISLFCDLAINILKESNDNLVEIRKNKHHYISNLLSPIAALMKEIPITTGNKELYNEFRKMWFCCIVFDFVEEHTYSNLTEIHEACQKIAQYSPFLVDSNSKYNFEETESIINLIGFNKDWSEFQASLLACIPNPDQYCSNIVSTSKSRKFLPKNVIKRLSFNEVIYLLSVYHLETLRVMKNHSVNFILSYYEDFSLITREEAYTILHFIVQQVFHQWLDYVSLHKKYQIIEDQTCNLIISYPNRLKYIQQAVKNKLIEVSTKFDFLFWSTKCLTVLLDLLKKICDNVDQGIFQTSLKIINLENGNRQNLILPQNFSMRKVMFIDVSHLVIDWIKMGLKYAPNLIRESLQQYFLNFKSGYVDHVGYSIAILLTTPKNIEYRSTKFNAYPKIFSPQMMERIPFIRNKKKSSLSKLLNVLNESRIYSITESLVTKSFNIGLLSSMKDFAFKGKQQLNKYLLEKMNTNFDYFMKLTTVYLIDEKELSVLLVQWLIWKPILLFTKESLKIGVFCWNWLLNTRPEFEITFLHEFYYAFEYTIRKKMGLFSGKVEEKELGRIDKSKDKPKIDFIPHMMIINFLADRVSSAISKEKYYINLFFRIVLKAIDDPHKLSTLPSSLGTRFRLLFLGLVLARHYNDDYFSPIIRKKVYNASLYWFCQKPGWYNPDSLQILSEDLNVLEVFLKLLKKEKRGSSTTDEVMFGDNDLKSEITASSSVRSRRSMRLSMRLNRDSLFLNEKITTQRNANSIYPEKAHDRVSILLLLLRHEINRILIWHHPRNYDEASSKYVKGDHKRKKKRRNRVKLEKKKMKGKDNLGFEVWDFSRINGNKWFAYFDAAWEFSPELSIQMYFRFVNHFSIFPKVFQRIRKDYFEFSIRAKAKDLQNIQNAVEFLVHPNEQGTSIVEIPQMNYLYLWKTTKLTKAFKYLYSIYVECSYLREYAIRSLKRYSPEELIVFLPQLVQLLRYDKKSNRLKSMLINVCKDSIHFTHQLIWQLRNEIINPNEEPEKPFSESDYQISEIAADFVEDIVYSFGKEETLMYNNEFGFFDKMTDLSTKLMPWQQSADHVKRGKIVEFIQDIKIPENAYLPTSKEYLIKEIVTEKCIPLKSAKKVPILVPFKVQKRDSDKSTSNNDNPIQTQALIFKSGDDCRMDQIALQFVKLFQRIFQKEGLPLYLYPYQVIPTDFGCGIIEVIPNSDTIHNIKGKYGGSLLDIYKKIFGNENGVTFQTARKNFIESMAGYSVVSYILSITDRHNGNIMINNLGHLQHIDFGFILEYGPGGGFTIEKTVPFKLNAEMIELIIGKHQSNRSEAYELFMDLFIRGYLVSSEYAEEFVNIVEILLQMDLPCFKGDCINNLKQRLSISKNEENVVKNSIALINKSDTNVLSKVYDRYQYYLEDILM